MVLKFMEELFKKSCNTSKMLFSDGSLCTSDSTTNMSAGHVAISSEPFFLETVPWELLTRWE